jgi:hypothetical protein
MHAMDDLDQLERTAFKRFYDDGMLDIFMGVMIGTMPAVARLTDLTDGVFGRLAVYFAVYGVMVGAFMVARRKITVPRLGTFKPSRARRRRIRTVHLVFSLSVVLGLALMLIFATGNGGAQLANVVPLMFLVNATVVFGAAAYFLDVARFWAYGPAFGLPIVVDSALNNAWDVSLPAWVVFGLPGLTVTVVGAVILVRFVRRYPVPARGA